MFRYLGLFVEVEPPRVLAKGKKRNLRHGRVDDHIRLLPITRNLTSAQRSLVIKSRGKNC